MAQGDDPSAPFEGTSRPQAVPYCNWVAVHSSQIDFFASFGQTAPTLDEGSENGAAVGPEPVILIGRIAMSPQAAKALSGLLQEQLSQYEAAYGQITGEKQ